MIVAPMIKKMKSKGKQSYISCTIIKKQFKLKWMLKSMFLTDLHSKHSHTHAVEENFWPVSTLIIYIYC